MDGYIDMNADLRESVVLVWRKHAVFPSIAAALWDLVVLGSRFVPKAVPPVCVVVHPTALELPTQTQTDHNDPY